MVTITLGDMLSLVGIIIVMFLMNWQLALVTIVVLPLLVLIMGVWQRYARVAFIRIRYAISVVNSRLQQNISGVRVVQSMNREDLNLRQFDRVNMDHLDANLRAIRLSAILMPTVDLITAVALGLSSSLAAPWCSTKAWEQAHSSHSLSTCSASTTPYATSPCSTPSSSAP